MTETDHTKGHGHLKPLGLAARVVSDRAARLDPARSTDFLGLPLPAWTSHLGNKRMEHLDHFIDDLVDSQIQDALVPGETDLAQGSGKGVGA